MISLTLLKKVRIEYIFLALFSILLVAINIYWTKRDTALPSYDQSWYLENSIHIYNSYKSEGLSGLSKSYVNAFSGQKAPLLSLLPLPFYLILGPKENAAMIVNWVSLLLLNYYLFLLVRKLVNIKVALISVFITQTMPLFYALNRQFYVEYLLTLLVVIFLQILLKDNVFHSIRNCISLGIVAALGLLTKVNFPMYVLVPSVYIFIKEITKKNVPLEKIIINISVAIFIFIVVSSTWYYPNFNTISKFAISTSYGEIAKDYGSTNVYSLSTVLNYFKSISRNGISVYYSILLIASLFSFKNLNREKLNIFLFLFSWFLFPALLLTFGVNKEIRYIQPILPVLAIQISLLINEYKFKKKHQNIFWILLFIFPIYQLFNLSFFNKIKTDSSSHLYSPSQNNWKTQEIIDYISGQPKYSRYSLVLDSKSQINHNNYSYLLAKTHPNENIYFTGPVLNRNSTDDILSRIKVIDPDYIIISDEISNSRDLEIFTSFNKLIENSAIPYSLQKTFISNTGKNINIYKIFFPIIKKTQSDVTKPFNNKISVLSYTLSKTSKYVQFSAVISQNDYTPHDEYVFKISCTLAKIPIREGQTFFSPETWLFNTDENHLNDQNYIIINNTFSNVDNDCTLKLQMFDSVTNLKIGNDIVLN
ncbi:MAG: glycosyltransferase family 39 protein [Candidatus Shapirobacteria bacterium]|jgi:4-amino-4-deoxy-L-arabinose transferase-like glycosyltransferase